MPRTRAQCWTASRLWSRSCLTAASLVLLTGACGRAKEAAAGADGESGRVAASASSEVERDGGGAIDSRDPAGSAPDSTPDGTPDSAAAAMSGAPAANASCAAPACPECPAPLQDAISAGAPVWARNPDTGDCCRYQAVGYAPAVWPVFDTMEACQTDCRCASLEGF